MLAYPPFMQRPPFSGLDALPRGLPSFPQFPIGPQFAFSSPASTGFALHAQIPAFPPQAGSPMQERDLTPKSPTHGGQQHASAAPKAGQSSFSIASILGKESDRERKDNNASSSSVANPAPLTESSSPSTPLSAGIKPNHLYYFYPQQAPSPFPFAAVQPNLEADLQRSTCGMGRLTAPVAVISEIVTNAGEPLQQSSILQNFRGECNFNISFVLFVQITWQVLLICLDTE